MFNRKSFISQSSLCLRETESKILVVKSVRKRQKIVAQAQSQKGALDRFVVKEFPLNSENQTPNIFLEKISMKILKISFQEILDGFCFLVEHEVSLLL